MPAKKDNSPASKFFPSYFIHAKMVVYSVAILAHGNCQFGYKRLHSCSIQACGRRTNNQAKDKNFLNKKTSSAKISQDVFGK